jgi:hypothetical protein
LTNPHHGAAGLEMELGAIGGATDAEGLIAGRRNWSPGARHLRGRVKVSECHWKIGKVCGQGREDRVGAACFGQVTSTQPNSRRDAQVVFAAKGAGQKLEPRQMPRTGRSIAV